MLLTLLLYGYCTGVCSSRKITGGCETDLALRVLSGGQFPDFRTLSDFRKDHLEAFQALFLEVLRMCREAGLVKLGHLSLDGSKYQANASKHKAMSYGRIQEVEPQLEAGGGKRVAAPGGRGRRGRGRRVWAGAEGG